MGRARSEAGDTPRFAISSRSPRTVGGGTRADVEHDHDVPSVVDLVEHPPVATEASAVDPGELRTERFTDPTWVGEEWTGDELGRGCRDIYRQLLGEGAPGRWRGPE
jgi:hypothetical protein